MGTRSLTFVHDDNKVVINMYRQMDGYPSGHGKDLFDFLQPITLVNGIGCDGDRKIANGVGCLAAQMVAHFKDGPGRIYLYPASTKDCWQDYEYHIYGTFENAPLVVKVRDSKKQLFKGSLEEFGVWCLKPEEEN